MAERIRLVPNEPLTLNLLDPFADSSERYDPELRICEYRTTDGRILALPKAAAIALNNLNPQPDEEIGVCRYTGKQARIAVWLSASSEVARAQAETALESSEGQTDTELLLEASLKRETARKRRNGTPTPIRKEPAPAETIQPRLFDRGTGTDGPQRMPLIPAASGPTRRDRPMPIPWNIAFREVSAWVAKELAENKLQWSDQAQQAMVCTVLIAEAKAGRVTVWERAE